MNDTQTVNLLFFVHQRTLSYYRHIVKRRISVSLFFFLSVLLLLSLLFALYSDVLTVIIIYLYAIIIGYHCSYFRIEGGDFDWDWPAVLRLGKLLNIGKTRFEPNCK